MIVNLFQFSKRNNSTKLPQSGSGVEFSNVILKEPTDFLNPVIRFTASGLGGTTVAPIIYNYAQIPKFARYYFVNDWNYVGGCWECSLSVDSMGSWKASIGTTSAYVERAESSYDGTVIDGMFPATTDYDVVNSSLATPWYNVAPSGGSYVVGILNKYGTRRVGAVDYYAFTPSDMVTFLDWMFGSSIFTLSNITDISEGLFKSIFNPGQYIVSCNWFPFPASSFGENTTNISFGYWATGLQTVEVSNLARQSFVTGEFPNHPQASSRGSYLNYSPHSYYTLYIPPFGAISIDSSFRSYGKYIRCPVFIDHITGQATMRVGISTSSQGGTTAIWANEASAMFAVPVQLSQIMSDYSGIINGAVGAVSSGGLGSLLSGAVQSAIDSFNPSVSSIGSNGSFSTSVMPSGLISSFSRITGASDSILGRPLMAQRTINTLSGYIKCRNAKFSAPCLSGEKTMIEGFLNEGFYYE